MLSKRFDFLDILDGGIMFAVLEHTRRCNAQTDRQTARAVI
jgi:hypothetical protein